MFTDFISATTVGDGVVDLAGKTDFCYKFSGSSPTLYVYQHVLIIRWITSGQNFYWGQDPEAIPVGTTPCVIFLTNLAFDLVRS